MNIVHSYMMLYVKLPKGNVCMWFSQGFPDRPPGRYTEWHPWRLQEFLMEFTIQQKRMENLVKFNPRVTGELKRVIQCL